MGVGSNTNWPRQNFFSFARIDVSIMVLPDDAYQKITIKNSRNKKPLYYLTEKNKTKKQ